MGRRRVRRSYSVKARSSLLLKGLSIQRDTPCSALLDELIEAAARVAGIDVTDEAVEAEKSRLGGPKKRQSKPSRPVLVSFDEQREMQRKAFPT